MLSWAGVPVAGLFCGVAKDVGGGSGWPGGHGSVRRGCRRKLGSDVDWADDGGVCGCHYLAEGVVDTVFVALRLLLSGKLGLGCPGPGDVCDAPDLTVH